jgi:hypothetical protein
MQIKIAIPRRRNGDFVIFILLLSSLPKVLRFFNYYKYLKINHFYNYQFSITCIEFIEILIINHLKRAFQIEKRTFFKQKTF